jgi:hypothetical protein
MQLALLCVPVRDMMLTHQVVLLVAVVNWSQR